MEGKDSHFIFHLHKTFKLSYIVQNSNRYIATFILCILAEKHYIFSKKERLHCLKGSAARFITNTYFNNAYYYEISKLYKKYLLGGIIIPILIKGIFQIDDYSSLLI